MMYVTSFFPLWISIVFIDVVSIIEKHDVNTYTEWISMFSIILANVIAYVLIAIWLSIDGKNPSSEMRLISAKEEKRISAEFLLSYVLPLMAFDFTVWSSMIIFLFLFCLSGIYFYQT